MQKKTLFDKVWEKHVVDQIDDKLNMLYIDRHFIHEVTSPQAFSGIEKRGIAVFRPKQTIATADHNVPTENQHLEIKEELSRIQVEKLKENCSKHDIELYGLGHPYNGIVHVIGPELGITQPGMTLVCGDSHTSTHGAFGSIAFGIGTSEVEMVFASQCLIQAKPKRMLIQIDGDLLVGVTAKDIILYVLSKLTSAGATGYFIEFAGSAIDNLSMEGRMTLCNMSIELGARGGMIAPDQTTFDYIQGRQFAPNGEFEQKVKEWKQLKTDEGAGFDKSHYFESADIEPMITYGTNPGMGMKVTEKIPNRNGEDKDFTKALNYMNLERDKYILGHPIDYIFIGSCTNGRIEDLRDAAKIIKGRKKAPNVKGYIVPGSKQVEEQAIKEGIHDVFKEAGFELRQPGCSACLAMNEDKIPSGAYCVSTSNRNFEGRQGPGARTLLASPLTAAASAINGYITDPREFLI
jgi:3-isopropylmalate/(R)-2-methylmalate dehydratase large subunit